MAGGAAQQGLLLKPITTPVSGSQELSDWSKGLNPDLFGEGGFLGETSCISVVGITQLTSCVAGARVSQAAGVTSRLQAVAICRCGVSPRGNMREELFQNKAPLSPAPVCRWLFLIPSREKPGAKLGPSSQQGA